MALANYPICQPDAHLQTTALETSTATTEQMDQKPQLNNPSQGTYSHEQPKQPRSLNSRLKHYQSYLDDHETFRRRRSKSIALQKYCLIMRSIKSKSRDRFQFEYHEEDEDDDDEDVADLEGNIEEPFDQTQRSTSHTIFLISDGHSERPVSTTGQSKRRCDIDHCNKILRKHRARLVNDNNEHEAPIWSSSSIHHDQSNLNHEVTAYADDLTRMDYFT